MSVSIADRDPARVVRVLARKPSEPVQFFRESELEVFLCRYRDGEGEDAYWCDHGPGNCREEPGTCCCARYLSRL